MEKPEIYARLTTVFRDVFDDDTIVPHEQMTAQEVDSWDSLSNIRMIVAVEEEFGIHFSTAEVTDLRNVGEFVKAILGKTGQ